MLNAQAQQQGRKTAFVGYMELSWSWPVLTEACRVIVQSTNEPLANSQAESTFVRITDSA